MVNMKRTFVLILLSLVISIASCATEKLNVSASDDTVKKSNREVFSTEDINSFADKLCNSVQFNSLAQNTKQFEFIAHMVGEEWIAENYHESLQDFVSDQVQANNDFVQNSPTPVFKTCESTAKTISCEEAVDLMKQSNMYSHMGVADENLGERMTFALNEMGIESCALVDFKFQLEENDSSRHTYVFISIFDEEPQMFYILDGAMMGKGIKIEAPTILPELSSYINDYEDVIPLDTEDELSFMISKLDTLTSAQLVILTIDTTGNRSIEDYATEIFNKTGIGDADKNNGVLILVATKDRKVRIEVGYGLGGILSDETCQMIIDDIMVPNFKQGDFETGLYEGTLSVLKELSRFYDVDID